MLKKIPHSIAWWGRVQKKTLFDLLFNSEIILYPEFSPAKENPFCMIFLRGLSRLSQINHVTNSVRLICVYHFGRRPFCTVVLVQISRQQAVYLRRRMCWKFRWRVPRSPWFAQCSYALELIALRESIKILNISSKRMVMMVCSAYRGAWASPNAPSHHFTNAPSI